MGRVDEVLAEMRQERERLIVELARVDRVIGALEEAAALAADAEERVSIVLPSGVTAPPAAEAALPPGIGPHTLLDIYEATFRAVRRTTIAQSRPRPRACGHSPMA